MTDPSTSVSDAPIVDDGCPSLCRKDSTVKQPTKEEKFMAMDTFMAYVGVYSSVEDAKADYDAVHDLHTEDGLIDADDAAVIERKDNGKVKIVKKHETPRASVGWAAEPSDSRPAWSSRCSPQRRSAADC